MKRVIFIVAVATLVLTLTTGAAFAGKGPPSPKTPPPCPETLVTVHGTIGTMVCANEYNFLADDGAAYILDCGPPWYKVVTLDPGAATVSGELEKSNTEIGVYKVTYDNGKEVVVRDPGKPPWAGGRH